MNLLERRIYVMLDPDRELQYQRLLLDYFRAAERGGRPSSGANIKEVAAIKESMANLCNSNPMKLKQLKDVVQTARFSQEKVIILTRTARVMKELYETFQRDRDTAGVLQLSPELSVHEVNERISRFSRSPEHPGLLLTDAANAGLDLTAANHIVHFDYPQRYTQIMQRNHRIARRTSTHGQVTVYYMLTEGKIDEFEFEACLEEAQGRDARASVL